MSAFAQTFIASISTVILGVALTGGAGIPRLATIPVESDGGIARLGEPGGKVRYKELKEYRDNLEKTLAPAAVDSTVFDLRYLSDSAFANMYDFWQEVDISRGSFWAPAVGDLDENGKAEIYGFQKLYTIPDHMIHGFIFEQDTSGIYGVVYSYPDSILRPLTIYDIDRDRVQEIVQRTVNGECEVFRAPSPGMLPTSPSFGFNPYADTDQMDDPTFDEFDGNGKTDVAYYLSSTQLSMFISEYDPASNTMDTVYRFKTPDFHAEGFSVGDFDMDGRTDLVLGSIHGYVYVVEARGVHEYRHVWTGRVETNNAYLHMKTNDIDGNGKPEFWVGGDAYYSGLGMTRFTCFERAADNSFQAVHRIDLIGVFSFFAGNCFAKDVDGDGKEELFICIDQHVIILKFIGAPNSHSYEMYFMKRNEMASQNSVYYGATLYDCTADDKDELLITMDQVITNIGRREFTRIYKPAIVVDVPNDPDPIPERYRLFQNYPNPFNSSTIIRFVVPSLRDKGKVQLRVSDILGREVRLLLDDGLPPGEHEVCWDGIDDTGRVVGSGVYLVVLQAGGHTEVVKALFLK